MTCCCGTRLSHVKRVDQWVRGTSNGHRPASTDGTHAVAQKRSSRDVSLVCVSFNTWAPAVAAQSSMVIERCRKRERQNTKQCQHDVKISLIRSLLFSIVEGSFSLRFLLRILPILFSRTFPGKKRHRSARTRFLSACAQAVSALCECLDRRPVKIVFSDRFRRA